MDRLDMQGAIAVIKRAQNASDYPPHNLRGWSCLEVQMVSRMTCLLRSDLLMRCR